MVKPGGNPAVIKFEYKGIKSTRIDSAGNLVIKTRFGELVHKKPVSYQVCNEQSEGGGEGVGLRAFPGERKYVDVRFKKIAENSYGFAVGAYDKSRSLIIDPLVLLYSTYLGGSNDDMGLGIAVDDSGNVYVTGYTERTDFPILNQYQADQGYRDAFVTKLDTTQSGAASLLYSTYLGGGDYDWGYGIAVDDSGNVYVMGSTLSADFPILNQYQADQGYVDAFVTKLDTTQGGAASLLYSTYLGGGSEDCGLGIAVDGSGNAYLTGWTESTDFPTLDQYQAYQGFYDAFVAKLIFSGLTVTSPNGGEIWQKETIRKITWNSQGITDGVMIILLKGNNAIETIAKIKNPTASTYLWKVGKVIGGGVVPLGADFRIKAQAINGSVSDMSDVPFTILPSLIITSPNGGESCKLNSRWNISWEAPELPGNVRISLVRNGVTVGTIVGNIPASAGTYSWKVGRYGGGMAPAGGGYQIKIKSIGSLVSDKSDKTFTLVE